MLDLNDLVKNVDLYIKKLNTRGQDYSYLNKLVKIVKERNKIIFSNDNLRKQRNNISINISVLLKEKNINNIDNLKNKIKSIKKNIDLNIQKITDYDAKILEIALNTPNIPHETTPIGKNETDNVEIRKWGKIDKSKKTPHWDISINKNIIDYKITSENCGTRFVTYLKEAALLKRSLINFILDLHTKNDYIEISLPVLTKPESLFGTGQFPKFMSDSYVFNDGLVLIPTAEVSVTNFLRKNIIEVEKLPIKYCSFSECFRKEAGAAGKDTRGIIRLHEFSKVELVQFVHPDKSNSELNKLLNDAEIILQKLKLPYRVIELCTGDLGFAASKTYDIEVWMPSRQDYVEISSCSNFGNFQSRRIKIKYKENNKTNFLHTLNGSGLPLDRLIAAIIENYYSDKTKKITIPDVLWNYFGKKEF